MDAASAGDKTPLLDIAGLSVAFAGMTVVDRVTLTLDDGEVLGIVGESGSGKSVTAQATMGLLPDVARVTADRLNLMGEPLLGAGEKRLQRLRGAAMSMIFQEPMTALNPVLTIGRQIGETLLRHGAVTAGQARARSADLLSRVGIPSPREKLDEYPHQLSGGMRQRVMIAMAIACHPRLLFADEPTTALDVTIQAQILELLRELQQEYRMGIVLISHDLGVVSSFADRVAVMYAGRIVEDAPAASLFARPAHPYTRGLLASRPSASHDTPRLQAIPGTVPPPFDLPSGCRFRTRCALAQPACAQLDPPRLQVGPTHGAACLTPLAEAAA
ncbi:ABC transporter ATP-binding protein [Alsobacter sp. SYSU M60028]|uniref:ABC transporter ATP-binding protein n=1 Tax=Alsobacter ponti TaxID=2962936 RepID=A0ABT1LC69_9HYPH|nr:ABC transporter ATP-binding protein [Alsobacter ponti]MCP8939105.1 ABC transporter ATP-binding protein [Alsobacter ponti]